MWQKRTRRRFIDLLVVSVILLASSVVPLFFDFNMTTAGVHSARARQGAAVWNGLVRSSYLAAKNFLAHKHNEIVNMHRRNALRTFRDAS